ncbi:TlpA family protein disulfide reductase [Cellulophaga baltica]|uniref:TlpA family protein disulfide reductase n=1 Tax=Cellulophaga TaxID=104264 RepID=UPI001C07E2EF|nr:MULTISPECIES: TlpA disulfide reductase family protein [Cellulophaga]MBU2995353.1 TlpA family protein disulfide reductase [Cellulophaga baltica]MDO6766748.1 TlpA disulfide reductase family protein [Cellulophaga sp. 1_MG-2023]
MIKYYLVSLSLITLLLTSCNDSAKKQQQQQPEATPTQVVEDIKVYNYDGLDPLLHKNDDTTYIINFWATWCAPCVKELPHFQEYYEQHNHEKMKMIMVSMDDPKDITSKITPFIEKKNLQQEVIILDDPDANTWIDKINPNWSGALPFTIIYNKNKRAYFDTPFNSYEELEKAVQQTIKQ